MEANINQLRRSVHQPILIVTNQFNNTLFDKLRETYGNENIITSDDVIFNSGLQENILEDIRTKVWFRSIIDNLLLVHTKDFMGNFFSSYSHSVIVRRHFRNYRFLLHTLPIFGIHYPFDKIAHGAIATGIVLLLVCLTTVRVRIFVHKKKRRNCKY